MVSWVPELLLPCLLALAFLRDLPRRWVLAMAPTTYLADIDYALPASWADALGMDHLHRVVTHTLVWPTLLLLGIWWAWRRHRAAGEASSFWRYAVTPGWPLATLLLCYYLTAHSLMDIFTGGVVLFWPLSNFNFWLDVGIVVNLQTGDVDAHAAPGTSQGPNPIDQAYPWLTNEHAAMLALVLTVLAGVALRWWWLRRQARSAAEERSPTPSTKGK